VVPPPLSTSFFLYPPDDTPAIINLHLVDDIARWMDVPSNIYIGRKCRKVSIESKWHNPFRITPSSTRSMVVADYEQYLRKNDILLEKLYKLRNRTMGCWCAPLECHGNIIVNLYNELVKVFVV
jgi:hypothetical protein